MVLRSIGAVAAGYIIFAMSAAVLFHLAGLSPDAHASTAFKVGSSIYGCIFALIGGMLAIRLAPQHPAVHAVIVAGLIAAGALISMMLGGVSAGAHWSQIAALTLMAPCAALAALIFHPRR